MTLGQNLNTVKCYTTGTTASVILLVGSLSLLYYKQSWKYRDVYQDASTVDIWLIMNGVSALVTAVL